MNAYFVIRLIVDLLVTVLLLRLLVKACRMFTVKRAKKPYVLYLPTLISLVVIFQIIFALGPKVLDTVRLISSTPSYKQIQVESLRSVPGALHATDGLTYYYNPLSVKAETGEMLSIRYLSNSRYIVQIEAREVLPENIDGESK